MKTTWLVASVLAVYVAVVSAAVFLHHQAPGTKSAVQHPGPCPSRVYLTGTVGITPLTASALRAALACEGSSPILVLDSHGGGEASALDLAALVRERHLDVEVEDRCESACTLLFFASQHRAARLAARIGVHRPNSFSQLITQRDVEALAQIYAGLGVTADVIERMRTTSFDTIYWLTEEELRRNDVQMLPRGASETRCIEWTMQVDARSTLNEGELRSHFEEFLSNARRYCLVSGVLGD